MNRRYNAPQPETVGMTSTEIKQWQAEQAARRERNRQWNQCAPQTEAVLLSGALATLAQQWPEGGAR